mmetsp:Transcript_11467/g.27539  ORF Transcript_11467/g.27539 Transcript_11467/m.27539 type:complete len:201 (+) Transcript_11467:1546-2148(+)
MRWGLATRRADRRRRRSRTGCMRFSAGCRRSRARPRASSAWCSLGRQRQRRLLWQTRAKTWTSRKDRRTRTGIRTRIRIRGAPHRQSRKGGTQQPPPSQGRRFQCSERIVWMRRMLMVMRKSRTGRVWIRSAQTSYRPWRRWGQKTLCPACLVHAQQAPSAGPRRCMSRCLHGSAFADTCKSWSLQRSAREIRFEMQCVP